MQPHQKTAIITGVIQAHRQGVLLTKACATFGVTLASLRRMVGEFPELSEMLRDAEQDFNDALAEAMLQIDSDPTWGSTDPKIMAVLSKNIQWYLARKDRERYGDKVEVVTSTTADQAILGALRAAIERIPMPASSAEAFTITAAYADITKEAAPVDRPVPPPPPPRPLAIAPPPIPKPLY